MGFNADRLLSVRLQALAAIALTTSLSTTLGLATSLLGASPARAGEPKVLEAQVEAAGADGDLRFFNVTATIDHADEGWRHYADAFEVLDAATGQFLGKRTLNHPHENERPFTRTLYRLETPKGVRRIQIRAHDTVHGYGEAVSVDLPE